MKILKILTFIFTPFFLFSQDKVAVEEVQNGFSFPVDIAFDHNNNMFVIEKRGTIAFVRSDGKKTSSFFLDIRDRVNSSANERGLLGIALDPNYATNGYFYVNYTGNNFTKIARFTNTSDSTADKSTEVEIITIAQPYSNHNGGTLHFGPDGFLYIGMGDGGSAGDPENRSQNKKELLGKMLRIDVSGPTPYQVPEDNPFLNEPDTYDEIWALGLRNPWKFSFDMLTGDLYIGDVGQNNWEEIDLQRASSTGGENYGWRCYEGFSSFKPSGCDPISTYTSPIFVYETNENIDGCSITGGYVYRGTEVPYLQGRYVYGDFCTGKIWALAQDDCGNWVNEYIYKISSQDLSTFGQDINGEIYIAEVGKGTVSRIKPNCMLTSEVLVTQPSCESKGKIEVTSNSATANISITGGELNNLENGVYVITVSDGSCINTYCVELAFEGGFDFPTIDAADPLTICEGEPFTFTFSPPILANYPNLTMDLYLDTVLLVTNWNGNYSFEKPGIYYLKFVNNDGCSTGLIPLFDITVAPVPDIFIEKIGETLVATPGFITYLWYEGTTALIGEMTNTLKTITPGKNYSVIGYTLAGCLAISEKFLVSSTSNVALLQSFSISPNPTIESISLDISFNKPISASIFLYSLKGEQLLSMETPKANRVLEKIKLKERGVFLLQVNADGQTFSRKIIRE